MKGASRIETPCSADRIEPAFAASHMADLLTIDDVKDGGAFLIACGAQAIHHLWGHVKSSRLQNERCNCKARQHVAACVFRRPP